MKKEMFDTIDGKILRTFQIVKKVGQGAYGQVWKAKDKKTSSFCALKKIYDAFRNSTDAQRAYREIKYLQKLSHPNIIKILQFFKPENTRDIYIALQFMQADLSTAIRNNVLREIHKHFIFFQITQAVNYLHSAQLIHRDLKPSNILVNENCEVKLCDFGLIRSLVPCEGHSKVILTENIATRWYRAPQILLCSNNYGKQIDIWSLGCILAEIFLGRPIFQGSSSISQLQKIFEVTGKPCREQLTFVRSQASRSIVQSMTVSKKRSLNDIFYKADKQFIDLLQRIFQINPKKRITIEEIVKHPFVNRFKGRTQQHKIHEPIKITHESEALTPEQYRHLLYSELEEKHYPFQCNTGKTSQMSTFYESSITHSLPNNSRQQFFTNNCPLGRPDRPSPQRQNNQSKFLPLPSVQCLQEMIKVDSQQKLKQTWKKPSDISIKYNTQVKIQRNLNFPFNSQNNLRIFKDKSEEKIRAFKATQLSIKKTYTPLKIKQNSPGNRHSSNDKLFNPRQMRDLLPSKTPPKLKQHEAFLKIPRENQIALQGNYQRRGSRSPCNNKNETVFNPNRTVGPRQEFKREKIVPKFILQGRKKFRSGSPHQLQQKVAQQMINKQKKYMLLPAPVNHSFKVNQTISNFQARPSFQFQNQFVSPQHRQNVRNQLFSPKNMK